MSILMPANPPIDTPRSEQQIFRLLSKPDTLPNWTFIHSSSHHIPDHGLPREIDFLALVPNYGMICIEVKGGHFYVQSGQWYRANNDAPMEAPTRQAEQAMYALQHELYQKFGPGPIGNIPCECAVVFTDAEWPANIRRPRATVIDATDIQADSLALRLTATALRLRPAAGPKRRLPPTPPRVIDDIRRYLVPDFDLLPVLQDVDWKDHVTLPAAV